MNDHTYSLHLLRELSYATFFTSILVADSGCQSDPPSATSATISTSSSSASASATGPDSDSEGASTGGSSTTTTSTGPDTGTTTETSTSADETTNSTETSTGGDSSGTGEGACGNGMLDPGEACDLGPLNDNLGECTKACELATCGDNFKQPGEDCDWGPDNHDSQQNGCTTHCLLGPHCGDGIVQNDYEDCDPNDPNLGQPALCMLCKWSGKRVFVSSEILTGDLGGLAGADATCQNLAAAAGLGDEQEIFRAWLSSADTTAAQRLQHSEDPYILVDGTIIAENWEDLTDGELEHPIDLNEHNIEMISTPQVWTNTTISGSRRSLQHDCNKWTSSSITSTAHIGWATESNEEWTHGEASPLDCANEHRLYCIEQ